MPPRITTLPIAINVQPINDGVPTWNGGPFVTDILESVDIGYRIYRMLATDIDDPTHNHGHVQYNIQNGNVDNKFDIDRESGDVTVSADVLFRQLSLSKEYRKNGVMALLNLNLKSIKRLHRKF